MSDDFEKWAKRLRVAFNGENFRAWAGATANLLGDRLYDWAQASAKEHFPAWASTTGFALLASERQIPIGSAETTASTRARLKAWRHQHRLRGTPLGLLIQLYYNGWTNAVVVQQNGRGATINATPDLADIGDDMVAAPSWLTVTTLANGNPLIPASTDGKAAIPAMTVPWWTMSGSQMDAAGNQFCSRFDILIPAPGEPAGFELTTAANLAKIRAIIRDWKPSKATCTRIIVSTSGTMWGWAPLWGGFNWGGVTTIYAGAA